MSAPDKPGWLRKANRPFSELGSDPGLCHTHQNGECLSPACAPGPEGTCRQRWRRERSQGVRNDS